jgi:beta-N-acetylhexosaminidase
LGNTPIDTHVAIAVIRGPVDYLWAHDLIPFRAAVQAEAATVMISHVRFEALDHQHPATLSAAVADKLLRQEIGFGGLSATDCMEMQAVAAAYSPGESAVLAAQAGIDMILFSHTPERQSAAYEAVLAAAQEGRIPLTRIDNAVQHIQAVKAQFAITQPPRPELIRQPDHLALAQKAARAGVVLLRHQADLFPLPADKKAVLVEFISFMDSEAADTLSNFGAIFQAALPHVPQVKLSPKTLDESALATALHAAQQADILILATRNAHLLPDQLTAAKRLLNSAPHKILLCLRNPYDVAVLPPAQVALCASGDSTPSLQAVVDALLGKFTPSGKLTVKLEV